MLTRLPKVDYRTLVDRAYLPAIFVRDKVIVAVNDRFCSEMGRRPEDVLHLDYSVVFDGDVLSEFFETDGKQMESMTLTGLEYLIEREVGEAQYYHCNLLPYDHGYLITFKRQAAQDYMPLRVISTTSKYIDSLTKLFNKNALEKIMSKVLADHAGKSFFVFFVDLDRFKWVNDNLGHKVGDELLVNVAKRMKKCVRSSDYIIRWGGDEFIVILLTDDAAAVRRIADSMLASLSSSFSLSGNSVSISGSIGIARYPDDGKDALALVKNADAAMYAAKEGGKNCHAFFSSSLRALLAKRLDLERTARNGVKQNLFYMVYQPQVDVRTGKIVGGEAFLRCKIPTSNPYLPREIVSTAEEIGEIREITKYTLEKASVFIASAIDYLSEGFRLSVNISPVMLSYLKVAELFDEVRIRTGVPGSYIIEISESRIVTDLSKSLESLCTLRDRGYAIAIDDFGTGWSSLMYLRQARVEKIKIDFSLISAMDQCEDSRMVIRSIIGIARGFGIRVIAEGVETSEQLKVLDALGCDEYQGKVFSGPIDPIGFLKLLQQQKEGAVAPSVSKIGVR